MVTSHTVLLEITRNCPCVVSRSQQNNSRSRFVSFPSLSVQNQSSQLGAGAARLGWEALPRARQPGTWWSEASASSEQWWRLRWQRAAAASGDGGVCESSGPAAAGGIDGERQRGRQGSEDGEAGRGERVYRHGTCSQLARPPPAAADATTRHTRWPPQLRTCKPCQNPAT